MVGETHKVGETQEFKPSEAYKSYANACANAFKRASRS